MQQLRNHVAGLALAPEAVFPHIFPVPDFKPSDSHRSVLPISFHSIIRKSLGENAERFFNDLPVRSLLGGLEFLCGRR